MNRPYTIKQYKEIVRKIRKAMPGVSISTDTILGFCGETLWDFWLTKRLYRQLKFDMAYLAEYSERKGTAASKVLKDNVGKKEKVRRKKSLNEVLIKNSLAYNQKFLGRTIKVLVERKSKDHWLGRNEEMKSVEFKIAGNTDEMIKDDDTRPPRLSQPACQAERGGQGESDGGQVDLMGQFVNVKITKVKPWSLKGNLI